MTLEDLSRPFSKELYIGITEELIGHDFIKDTRDIKINNSAKLIKSIENLGYYPDLNLQVLIVRHGSENDARVGLSKELFGILRDYSFGNAIIATYSNNANWRYSLVTSNLKISTGGKVVREFSNPKRFSYILGPHAKISTPHRYLIKSGKISDFEDLQNRFSVEVVNNDFYKEIARLYDQLVGVDSDSSLLKYPESGEARHQFAVRLIGRVVFCWFLREKKSVNHLALVSTDVLSFGASRSNDYYNKVLAPLFFEVLNQPIGRRKDQYRVDEFGKIPYLNGGLFSPHKDDHYRFSDTAKSHENAVYISDEWLRDFFELLETYNFTVDENTSIDIDLSIDPEMLGRIFESLLARINPETEETARKITGSFYTPREIVEYMVDESLAQYLITNTDISEDKIRSVISYELEDDLKHGLTYEDKELLVTKLNNIKVLDPACGSGAFPVGMLQKLVFVLQQIDPDSRLWFERQVENATPEVKSLVEKEFRNKNFDYIRKLGIIRESIFGVDVQPIATEIARLRCFLTLIVDESIDDEEDNRGVHPLPNLDFKFVTANSLIKLNIPKVDRSSQTGLFEDKDSILALKDIRNDYFNSHHSEKDSLKYQFSQTQKQMLRNIISSNSRGLADMTHKLSNWDPFENEQVEWFDAEWMFGIEKGFDIVIGNPPYIDSESMTRNDPAQRAALTAQYSVAKGNWDLFVVFIEHAVRSLANGGTLSFIVPNKLIAAKYTETLRKYLLERSILTIRDYSRFKVFKEADVYPVVMVCSNTQDASNKVTMATVSPDDISELLIQNEVDRGIFSSDIYWDRYFSPKDTLNLLIKMSKQKRLNRYCKTILGASTVSEAYRIKEYIRDEDAGSNSSKEVKKFINTGTIDPYTSKWATVKTQYIKQGYVRPVISDEDIAKISETRLSQSKSEKIIIAGMSNKLEAIYDNGEIIAGKSTSIILPNQLIDIELKLLLAILNSRATSFWFFNYFKSLAMAGGYININQNELMQLPIPSFEEDQVSTGRILDLVNKLDDIESKNTSENKELEFVSIIKDIDVLIYKLYGLTPEEITIIERQTDVH